MNSFFFNMSSFNYISTIKQRFSKEDWDFVLNEVNHYEMHYPVKFNHNSKKYFALVIIAIWNSNLIKKIEIKTLAELLDLFNFKNKFDFHKTLKQIGLSLALLNNKEITANETSSSIIIENMLADKDITYYDVAKRYAKINKFHETTIGYNARWLGPIKQKRYSAALLVVIWKMREFNSISHKQIANDFNVSNLTLRKYLSKYESNLVMYNNSYGLYKKLTYSMKKEDASDISIIQPLSLSTIARCFFFAKLHLDNNQK